MSRIVAHLIVGAKFEPFLGAMLESIAPAVERIFVNENSGLGEGAPNLPALRSCALARDGKLVMAQTTFESFASARNVCFDLDREAAPGTWVVFIDADEVHFERFARIASQLDKVPDDVGYVDGYTWHFYFSFDWYYSIERRMMFHRWTPAARWGGDVHEQLTGIPPRRIALPYVYAHYGNVAPFSEHVRKGTQYSGLGAEGTPLSAQAAHAADLESDFSGVDEYYREFWKTLMRFKGRHPRAALATIQSEMARFGRRSTAAIERTIHKYQPPGQRIRNFLMKLNYEYRWRARAVDARRYGIEI